MSLTSFSISNQKSIRLAAAEQVPPIMVIAGPNGVGKSTILYGIKQGAGVVTPGTKLLYQGPHRVLRKTTVSRRWLTGALQSFMDLIAGADVSGYEGLSFGNAARTPDNVDEAGSTIKHTVGKIENRRQSIHSALIDRRRVEKDTIDPAVLPDVYGPLRDLTKFLLPHLEFSRVDFQNEDNIRCLWTRKDDNQSLEIDIDDLSSGEKSIIVLFLPLIEDQIREKLQSLENMASGLDAASAQIEDRVFLIDEPEQHLHPDLQAKLLGYVRRVALDSRTQFVLSTHSPTILDQATDEELYVLVAPTAAGTENQLKKIATSLERLEALKQLAGSTYFLTTGRVLVCIEGETTPPDEMSDLSLLEIIYPRATAFTLVPSGGKGNVINTVQRFREHLPEDVFRLRVRGLVDADQTETNTPQGIWVLPVCMIENFLLDPEALLEYGRIIGIEKFANSEAVLEELRLIMREMRDEEIKRRVGRQLKAHTVRVAGATVGEVEAVHRAAIETVQNMVPSGDKLTAIITQVTTEVDQFLQTDQALSRFHGKTVLKRFYARTFSSAGVSYSEVCLGIAKALGNNEALAAQLNSIFDQIAG